jgi:diaminohydroxyphosphoribosylaminopyrimidine deaminase / 5-amino-6-(5-phosphoribosylamino)uracil reductase
LGSFIERKLLNRLRLYIGPCILGSEGLPLFRTEGIATLNEAPRLDMLDSTTLGDTVRVDYAFLT